MAFSNLIEQIEQGTGKFDLDKQYFINNATDQDIEVKWAAKEPTARGHGTYLIKAGEKGGPYPQFLAYHIIKALVSREMQREGKARFFGSAEMRAPYEQKFLQEIHGNVEDALTASIREQERAKLLREMQINPIVDGVGVTSSETRRLAHEEAQALADTMGQPAQKPAKKGKKDDQEFQGANR